MEILNLLLDNEADPSQIDYFKSHIEGCMFCFEQYEISQYIKEMMKTHIESQPVPLELAKVIRHKIANG